MPLWGLSAVDTALAFSNGTSTTAGTALARGGGGIGVFVTGVLYGSVLTVGTAGNLQLRWTQNAAEAVNTRMKTESWIKLTRVVCCLDLIGYCFLHSKMRRPHQGLVPITQFAWERCSR